MFDAFKSPPPGPGDIPSLLPIPLCHTAEAARGLLTLTPGIPAPSTLGTSAGEILVSRNDRDYLFVTREGTVQSYQTLEGRAWFSSGFMHPGSRGTRGTK